MGRWKQNLIVAALAAGVACGSWRLRAQEKTRFDSPEAAARAMGLAMRSKSYAAPSVEWDDLFSWRGLEQNDTDFRALLALELLSEPVSQRVQATVTQRQRSRAAVRLRLDEPRDLPPLSCVLEGGSWKIDALSTARAWVQQDPRSTTRLAQLLRDIKADAAPGPRANRLCQSRLKGLGLALMQYAQDYDEKLPPANKWAQGAAPYTASAATGSGKGQIVPPRASHDAGKLPFFHCPALGEGGWGYSMNWNLSRQPLARAYASQNVLLYESTSRRLNATFDGRDLDSRRHHAAQVAGANFLFADGHVGFLRASQTPSFHLAVPNPSEAPRVYTLPGVKVIR